MKDNVRSQVGKPLNETMNDFIDNKTNEDENLDWYSGIVVDNNDPDKQGKCKIRVYGIFGPDIPDKDLPWAIPDFSFIGSKVGNFIVPPKDAIVKVYFDNGEVYLPHYTSKAVTNSQSTQKNTDYPDNMVMWETDDGDYLTINRKSKETTFNHSSGTKALIKKDGSVEFTVVKKKTETITGDAIIDGKANVTIKHGLLLTVEGSNVVPLGTGPLCAMPYDPLTGAPQTGKVCAP